MSVLETVGRVVAIVSYLVEIVILDVFLSPLFAELLRGYALLGGGDLYRGSMCVLCAAVKDVVVSKLEEPDVDIGLRVLQQMAYMNRVIGVDERRCYQYPLLELLYVWFPLKFSIE